MAYTLNQYFTTINVTASGQALWEPPSQTVLWPTYFTLVQSCITSVFAVVVLAAYFYSTETADRVDDWRSRLIWLALAVKLGIEVATSSSMYATGVNAPANGPQSLWFQTCTMSPDQITLFSFAINLPQYCTMQVFLHIMTCSNESDGEAFLPFCQSLWIFCPR
jgi:hypothetical protein